MRKSRHIPASLTFFLLLFFLTYAAAADLSEQTQDLISIKVTEYAGTPEYTLAGEIIYTSEMLGRFYRTRDYRPAWSSNTGPGEHAQTLVSIIKEVGDHGLVPEYYHLAAIESLLKQGRGPSKKAETTPVILAELDLLLTDAFLMLGCHFSAGCIDPETVEARWHERHSDPDIDVVLEQALQQDLLAETLTGLLPAQDAYSRLLREFESYNDLADRDGWPYISDTLTLKKGGRHSRVNKLRKRLALSGDLDFKHGGMFFDAGLEKAVKRFQERHGLKPDGVVGKSTFEALNIPVQERIDQIKINLERMRWLSGVLGSRYIKVNISDFKLDVIENDQTVMSMAVVVGKPYWHTPVFSEQMTYMVLNPFWNIPRSIMQEDVLPEIKRSPDHLTKNGIKVLSGWNDDAIEVDPQSIDWTKISVKSFDLRLRQEPGPKNPLGRIKFMFPNKYNVYLHDTPHKKLFSNLVRAFSHGCIRIERPIDLAEYLLRDNPAWNREKLLAAIETNSKQSIRLINPIDVHILYLTAWVDEQGVMQFRNDVYKRDKQLYEALRKSPRARPTAKSK